MADLQLCVLIQALGLTPVSFSLIAGAGANASIGGVVDVTNGNVADLSGGAPSSITLCSVSYW